SRPTAARSAGWACTRSTSTSSTCPPGSAARRRALTPSARPAAGVRLPTARTTIRTSTSRPSFAAARSDWGGQAPHGSHARPPESARRPAEHGLQLEELLEAGLAPLAPVARLLVAAEAGVEVDLRTVQVHVAGSDPLGDPPGPLEVSGRDVAGEAVGRVVRDPDGVLVAVVGQDGEDGAEDLLP